MKTEDTFVKKIEIFLLPYLNIVGIEMSQNDYYFYEEMI